MELHWHAPKHSRHGDLVDLIAPYPFGPYEIEFGMVPTGDRPPRYYVRCCDHDGRTLPPWEVTFPTATEAKAFAERRVIEAERYGPHGKPMYRPFIDGQAKDCRCLYCGDWMVILPGDPEYDALMEIDACDNGLFIAADGSGPYRLMHPACTSKAEE